MQKTPNTPLPSGAQHYPVIVIGGGAAGLMCAAQAAKRGRHTLVLDHANKVGKKILMSGGGRCNFTNYFVEPDNYISQNPHFCKSALTRFTQYDFLDLVHQHQIAYHEKTLGQLFCDNKASDILTMLLDECANHGAIIKTRCEINKVTPLASAPAGTQARFVLATSQGTFTCESLVVASGGLSIPTMGATGFGYELAKQFGLSVTPTEASLVPFTLSGQLQTLAAELSGVSLPVSVTCGDQAFREGLLFTHRGLSGPSILQITNYWQPGHAITIDFLPEHNLHTILQNWQQEGERSSLKNLLSRVLPKRFVNQWLQVFLPSEFGDKNVHDLSDADKNQLVQTLQAWQITPGGTEGYRTAEVTLGGVNTDHVSSKTFECKTTPGLFFIGEVLDVTGWLGGFNFQWAWASGYCAAMYV